MIFGHHVSAAHSAASAGWIAGSCRGRWGTVGALVPNQYPLVLRVHAPAPSPGDWWSEYRELFEIVASVGERKRPAAWFAVWEGCGFDTATTHIAWPDLPTDAATRKARDEERAPFGAVNEPDQGKRSRRDDVSVECRPPASPTNATVRYEIPPAGPPTPADLVLVNRLRTMCARRPRERCVPGRCLTGSSESAGIRRMRNPGSARLVVRNEHLAVGAAIVVFEPLDSCLLRSVGAT